MRSVEFDFYVTFFDVTAWVQSKRHSIDVRQSCSRINGAEGTRMPGKQR